MSEPIQPQDGYVYTFDLAEGRGVWREPSAAGTLEPSAFGSPTVTVKLTAAAGVAETALRSDAQLALDVSIAPTWSGQHTFALVPTLPSQAASRFLASPSGASGTPTFRAIVASDLPGSFSGFANPTAQVGLSATNGAAATAMRSDAAPALSQSIAPTWTALHTWRQDGLDDLVTDTVVLTNDTPAGSSVVQYSPALRWRGNAWNLSTGASYPVHFRAVVETWHGDANSGSLSFKYSVGGAYSDAFRLYATGGAALGGTTGVPPAGVLNVATGLRVAGTAASGNVLRGNGTNFVSAQLAASDLSNGTTGSGAVVLATALNAYQPLDTTLTALAAFNSNGLMVQTAADTFAARTLTVTAGTGLSVTDGNGVAGNPTLAGVNASTTVKGVASFNSTNFSVASGAVNTIQNIDAAAAPTFAGLTLSGLTPGSVLFVGAGGTLAQDNANLFWNDTSNYLGLGTATPEAELTLEKPDNFVSIVGYGYNSTSGLIISGRQARGTKSSPAASQTTDALFAFNGRGHDGTAFSGARARFSIYAAENWTSTAQGTNLVLEHTINGTTGIRQIIRADATDGFVGINKNSSLTGQLHVQSRLATHKTIVVQGASSQSANLIEAQNSSGSALASISSTGEGTFPGLTLSNLTAGSIPFAGTGGLISQDNANFFWDDTNNWLGLGKAPTQAQFDASVTFTETSGERFGGFFLVTPNPSASSSATFVGLRPSVEIPSANAQNFTGTIMGLGPRIFHSGSGTIAEARGVNLVMRNLGSGTITTGSGAVFYVSNESNGSITTARGGHFWINRAGAGTIGTAAGVYVDFTGSAGTLTNGHGVLVNATSGTSRSGITVAAVSGGTNNTHLLLGSTSIPAGDYSIYNVSASPSYFAGKVGIGTATPGTHALYVVGTMRVDTDLTLGNLIASAATANLFNATASTINFGGAATAINMGAASGTLTVSNPTVNLNSSTVASNSATLNLFNATTTTLNFAGAATALAVGNAAGTTTLNSGTVSLSGTLMTPGTAYVTDLGQTAKKFRTLHAAELVVETLVAQDTQATIGGRWLVGVTTQLIADLSTSATTVDVKHNNLLSGDRVRLESQGKVEWLAVTSNATAITGGYRYSVTRDLDGTGANAWDAGSAVFNTGQAGSGYWDVFSLNSTVTVAPDFAYNFNNTGSAFSANYAQSSGWSPFADGANTEVNDAVYFGVQNKTWSNLYFNLTTAASYSATLVWEYWNGSAWTAFVPTKVGNTGTSFGATGWQGFEWGTLASWAANSVNSQTAFWVRVRISAFTSWTTAPVQHKRVYYNKGQTGPTQVLWKRNSSTWSDVTEHAAFGELVGFYGYGASTVGIALGEYAAGKTHVTIDSTNGYRTFAGLSTVVHQIDVSGVITVGEVAAGRPNVRVTSSALELRNNTTVRSAINADGSAHFGTNIAISTGGVLTVGSWTVNSTTITGTATTLDSAGKLTLGTGADVAVLDAADSTYRIAVGHSTYASAPFRVTKAGALTSTSGNIAAWTIGATRLSSANVFIDQAGQYISMGATPPTSYGANVGVFIEGANSGRLSLYKDANNYLQWDSAKLLVKAANFTLDASGNVTASSATLSGAITATSGSITGDFTIGTGGTLRSGATAVLTGDGYWLDHNAGTPRLRVGTVSGGALVKGVYWDGANLQVKGTNFTLDSSGNITATGGTVGGWTLASTSITSTGVAIRSGATANVAFGATPPTASNSGTGVFIDATGFYGLSGGATQVKVSATDGALTAGGGNVKLNASGLQLTGNGSQYLMWLGSVSGSNAQYLTVSESGGKTVGVHGVQAFSASHPTAELVMRTVNQAGSLETDLYLRSPSDGAPGLAFITAFGNAVRLGIGYDPTSATPAATLDVNGAANIVGNLTVDTNTLFVDAANNRVGVGTATPSAPLHVNAATAAYASSTGHVLVTDSANTNRHLRLGYDAAVEAGWLQAALVGTGFKALLLNPNGGNVGMGTATPNPLNAASTDYGQVLTVSSPTAGARGVVEMQMATATTTVDRPVGQLNFLNGINLTAAIIGYNQTAGVSNNGYLSFYTLNAGTITERLRIRANGTLQFHAYGAGTLQTDASGNVTASSDEMLKDVSGAFALGAAALRGIVPITYKWKDSTGLDRSRDYYGYGARNVALHIPGATGANADGTLSLDLRAVSAVHTNAINEHSDEIGRHRDEITELRARVAQLEALLPGV